MRGTAVAGFSGMNEYSSAFAAVGAIKLRRPFRIRQRTLARRQTKPPRVSDFEVVEAKFARADRTEIRLELDVP